LFFQSGRKRLAADVSCAFTQSGSRRSLLARHSGSPENGIGSAMKLPSYCSAHDSGSFWQIVANLLKMPADGAA
jgi:hypothetical protein